METLKVLLLLGLMLIASVVAGPSGVKDLSDEEHYHGGTHNAEYDHEAFLGKEEAKTFHDLPPEEARRRLGILVDKIDTNSDGQVTQDELQRWISRVSKRYVYDDVDRMWSYHDTDNDGFINLDEYKEIYGKVEDPNAIYDQNRGITYKERLERDERKFKAADKNHDGRLNKDEFGAFLHPESEPTMRHMYIDESLRDMDKNKDGFVTFQEYINDRWPKKDQESATEEPDWVKSDREQFTTHRDKDQDGKLSREELGDWISPTDYDPTQAEARHLISHADADKDGALSKAEIVGNVDLFVGSQATEWGNFMTRHDEF